MFEGFPITQVVLVVGGVLIMFIAFAMVPAERIIDLKGCDRFKDSRPLDFEKCTEQITACNTLTKAQDKETCFVGMVDANKFIIGWDLRLLAIVGVSILLWFSPAIIKALPVDEVSWENIENFTDPKFQNRVRYELEVNNPQSVSDSHLKFKYFDKGRSAFVTLMDKHDSTLDSYAVINPVKGAKQVVLTDLASFEKHQRLVGKATLPKIAQTYIPTHEDKPISDKTIAELRRQIAPQGGEAIAGA